MASPQIQLALWLAQPGLQLLTAVMMFRRRLHKNFPAFFGYSIAQVVLFVVNFPVRKDPVLYFDVYYASAAINVVFAFKIIHEVFVDFFRPYPALQDLGTALFRWAGLIMILVALVMVSVGPAWDDPVKRTILIVQRCVDIVQCGMVIFLLAFCKRLCISWRRQSFGIVIGFGLFAGVELLANSFYSGSHIHGVLTTLLKLSAYDLSVFLWFAYTFLNRVESAVPILVPQRWDEALTEINPQSDAESLIPMFEHMVDRALSKAQDHA
jgi:hypothetical protein